MICTGVGSECPEWTERHVLCRHQHESVDSFVICTLLCILCWHQQVCADSRPQPKSKPQPKSQPQQKHGWPSFLRSSADQVFAATVGQSSPAKPAKNVMERLCRDCWDCRIFHASAIHKHVSVEPCAVFAKNDQEAREVKGRISAKQSDAPITLATLDSHSLPKVLVEPRPTVANVRLAEVRGESKVPPAANPKLGALMLSSMIARFKARTLMKLSPFALS